MTDKTAFEQWWKDVYCSDKEVVYTRWEHRAAREAWNAALNAAISKCDYWTEVMWPGGHGLEDCKEEIQKLRSE